MNAPLIVGASTEALFWVAVLIFGREVHTMIKRYRAEIAAALFGSLLGVILTFVVMALVGPLHMSL